MRTGQHLRKFVEKGLISLSKCAITIVLGSVKDDGVIVKWEQ